MRKTIAVILILFFQLNLTAQATIKPAKAFELIYDTIYLIKAIPFMDSLNASFAAKQRYSKHYSRKQGTASYLSLEQQNYQSALKDLEKNMPLEQFLQKYPKSQQQKNLLVLEELNTDYNNIPYTDFNVVDHYDLYFSIEDTALLPEIKRSGRIIKTSQNEKDASLFKIEALYFHSDTKRTKLPSKYEKMIDYVFAVNDSSLKPWASRTSFYEMFGDDYEKYRAYMENRHITVDSFLSIIHNILNIKAIVSAYSFEYELKMEIPDDKLSQIRELLIADCDLKDLFKKAIDSALTNYYSNNEFEYLVGQLISLKKELEIKRVRDFNYSCGNDPAPKIHFYNIANLAIKTGEYPVFLKMHNQILTSKLDPSVCNKRFCHNRKSYLDEWDFIHLNISDYFMGLLLTGINEYNDFSSSYYWEMFKMFNPKREKDLVRFVLEAIADKELDDNTRLCLAMFFADYCIYEKNENLKNENVSLLKKAVSGFPNCIIFSFENYKKSKEEY